MTPNNKRMLGVVVLAGLASAAFFGLRALRDETAVVPATGDESKTGTVSFLMEQQWQIRMKLALVEEAVVAPQVVSTGRIVAAPRNRAIVAPPVSGIITGDALPRIGQDVRRGQILTTLIQTPNAAESSQIRVEAARLEAEKRRLTQAAVESQVRLNQAKTEFDRARRLFEKKAYSQRQLESAEADFKAAEANLAAVNEQSKALNVAVTPEISYEVRAPISGTIVGVTKAAGEQVQPGEPILEIINLETVWLETPIFEHDLAEVQRQARAVFSTPSFPDQEFHAALIDLGAVIDDRSRAATAVFEVSNRDRRLRIGMQANVRLDAQEKRKTLMIPKEAVLEHEGKKIVYVLLSGEEFQRRELRLGDEYGSRVAVVDGLKPGERVVTQGAYQLKLQELRPAGPPTHSHEV